MSSEEPDSNAEEQYPANQRQSSSNMNNGTDCTPSSVDTFGDQTFSFAAILKETFSITEDALSKRQSSSGVIVETEDTHAHREDDQSEKPASAVDSLSERQSSSVNTKPYPWTVDASSNLEHSSASIAEDQSSQNQGALDNGEKMRDFSMAGLEDLMVSYTRLSENTPSIFRDISYMTVLDSEQPSSCSVDVECSAIDETTSKEVSGISQSASGVDRKNKTSHQSTEQLKQPPRKKIKLSKSVKIPVRDVLAGVHTQLCKSDCRSKHNPLLLAICAPDDYKLKKNLENHLKLAMKGAWSLDPKLNNRIHHLVHLAVLFGKYDLLKCLLNACLDRSDMDFTQNLPLHTVMTSMHQYMPSSSHQEKVMTFQRMLQLFAKYNCEILLARDKANEDTILHVCSRQIRRLTNQIKAVKFVFLGRDESMRQELLNQRQLLEGIFKVMIHTFKQLCTDGYLLHRQVIELFDCVNKAGETMTQILHEDELARSNRRVVASQVTATVPEEQSTECAKQQNSVAKETCEDAITEEDTTQLNTVTKMSGSRQSGNTNLSTQAANHFPTVSLSTNYPSFHSTASMRSTQTVVSTHAKAVNSTGSIALSTNCQSVVAPNGWPKQPASTTVLSTSVRIPQTVVSSQTGNLTGAITVPTHTPSVQAPNRMLKPPTSITPSPSVRIPQVLVSTQTENTTTNFPSVLAPNICQNHIASIAVFASLWAPPTVVSTQAGNSTGTITLPAECPSALVPNGWQKQPALTNVSASSRIPQAVVSTQVGNSTGSITLPTYSLSVQAPKGWPNHNASTTVSTSLWWVPQTVVSTQSGNSTGTIALPTKCPSVLAPNGWSKQSTTTTVSASVRIPQAVVSTQAGNSTGTITLPTNCPSALVPNGWQKQPALTTVSASARIPQAATQVGNSTGTIALPSYSLSVKTPKGWPNHNTSTTVSTSLWWVPQTVVSTQSGNSTGTITSSTNCSSVQAPSGSQNHHASTTVSASLWAPQSLVSTQAGNSTGTITLPTNCPSVLSPNGCQNHNVSTTVSATLWAPQTVVSSQAVNSTETTTSSTNSPADQAPKGWPNKSTSTTTTASMSTPQAVVSSTGNSTGTITLPTDCSSTPYGCQNHNALTTVSTTLWAPQTVASTQVGNSTGTIALATNSLSVQAPKGWPNQSTSTTETASMKIPQTIAPTQVTNSCGTTTLLTNHSSVEASNGCTSQTSLTTVSVSAPSQSVDTRAPVTETLTHDSDVPTMQVNSERRQSSTGKHTYLCSPECSLTHHKLVQLLCATPDHLSNDLATVEIESCAKLKDYLKKSHWDMSSVVPSPMPSLRLPIVHLACLLGKHKALWVLSELGFHPLIHTARTEETPLHMTMQLLRHQSSSSSVFLSEVVVSILKTLNRHSHAISLFSAKDKNGNSVLHAMAELISSNVPVSAALLYVHLFRVFVHFLLKGQQNIPESESLQILSSCLKECNKFGLDVESILQKSIYGQWLLEYLRDLMQKSVLVTSVGTQEGQHDTSTVQEQDGPGTGMGVRLMGEEPESLVDFILSADCKISSASKERIVQCYIAEYHNRLQLIRDRVASVKQELVLAGTLQMHITIARDNLNKIQSELKLNAKKMKLRGGEMKQKQKELLEQTRKKKELLRKRLKLIDRLQCKCLQVIHANDFPLN
ncbi:uncharacterized protein LOC144645265 isoform X2 [Oculina patagonica]